MSYQRLTPFAALGFRKQANVGSWIDDKWNKGQQAVTGAYDAASQGIDKAYNAGAGALTSVSNAVEDNVVAPAVGAYDSVSNGAREIKNGVGQIGSAAGGALKNVLQAPLNVVGGIGQGAGDGAAKGLGGFVQGAIDGGWNAGAQVGKDLTANSRQFETGLNQAGIADTQSHGLTSLPATRTPGVGVGSAVPASQPFPTSATPGQILNAPKATPVPSPTGYGQPKPAAPANNVVNNGHAPSMYQTGQFRKLHGGAYDPNSSADRQKMQGITKTAFAQLEKVALAKGVSKLFGSVGRGVSSMGSAAKAGAKPAALKKIKDAGGIAAVGGRDAGKAMLDKAKLVGDKRLSAGAGLQRAENAITDSKGVQNAINYGAGTVAGGAGLIGAHSMGQSSGREAGLTEGVDQGIGLGLEGAKAMQPGDPGFMGRLGDLFTGTQSGPDAATMRQGLTTERDKLIQSLLAR